MSSGKLRARDCFSRELDLDCNTQPRDAFAGLKTASLDSHCKRKRGCSLIVMCVFYMKASSISENKEKWLQKIPAAPAMRNRMPIFGHHPERLSEPLRALTVITVYTYKDCIWVLLCFQVVSCLSFHLARPWQKSCTAGCGARAGCGDEGRGAGAGCAPAMRAVGQGQGVAMRAVCLSAGRAYGGGSILRPSTRGRGFMNEI